MRLVEGQKERVRREDERRAYFAAWQIAPMTKKPPSPRDIIKPLYPKEVAEEENAQRKAEEAELRKTFNIEN